MNDAEFKQVKDWCRNAVDAWVKRLCLSHYDIDLIWERGTNPDSPRGMACVTSDWRYLHATITFWCPVIFENFKGGAPEDPDYMLTLVIHELTHILVGEMREWANPDNNPLDHEERVVTDLSRRLLNLYKLGIEENEGPWTWKVKNS